MDNSIVVAPSSVIEGVIVPQLPSARQRIDIMQMLLDQNTSKDSQRTYKAGWQAFFGESPRLADLWRSDPAGAVIEFCSWPPDQQRLECWDFQARLVKSNKSPATIQNRASAVRSLLKAAHDVGLSANNGTGLFPKQSVQKYRDTRGIPWEKAKLLVKAPAQQYPGDRPATRLRRLRDTAIMRLLVENGIRNSSLVSLDVEDFSLTELHLWIIEKRKGTQKRRITISSNLAQCIEVYIRASGHNHDPKKPLFLSLDRNPEHGYDRLSRNGLRDILREYTKAVGIKKLTPHRLRHTAISTLAKETKGDVIAMQEFSGHADINTLMIYARQSRDRQGELSNKLSSLLED